MTSLARIGTLLALPLILLSCRTATHSSTPAANDIGPQVDAIRTLMAREDVARAMAFVEADRAVTIAQWRTISEIAAPSGHESARAALIIDLLREYGLSNVHRDAVGNVLGTLVGRGGGKHVVFDAHIDTVFPLTTPLTTRIENGRLYGPGVGDDTRNIVAMLAQIRAMRHANIVPRGDITFLFTVREETDFGGINEFLKNHAQSVDRFVALDGGYGGFTYGGIGIYWYRYHFLGPGGHTRSSTPPYSATLPVAEAVRRIYALDVPHTWMNVGMLGAGDVFNAKASDAWFSADLRANVQSSLETLDREVARIVDEEARRYGMTVEREVVSQSQVASLPGHRNSEMVRIAEATWRAFGFEPSISDTASNHTSPALIAGVPAIGTGATPCGGAHSVEEWCEVEPIFTGIKRNIVLAIALSD